MIESKCRGMIGLKAQAGNGDLEEAARIQKQQNHGTSGLRGNTHKSIN